MERLKMGKTAENRKSTSNSNEGNGAVLEAHTTFRLEFLKYEEEMFMDENPITERSGWKLLMGKNFDDGVVTSSDIASFVDESYEMYKKSDMKFVDFDKARVCASLFTKFRCTVDESMLGFILKSKTVVEAKKLNVKAKKRFFMLRFFAWLWKLFKNFHNGILESLKIG